MSPQLITATDDKLYYQFKIYIAINHGLKFHQHHLTSSSKLRHDQLLQLDHQHRQECHTHSKQNVIVILEQVFVMVV